MIVGVGGTNFYARTPDEAYATLVLDTLLAPSAANLRTALQTLSELGFLFQAGGEPFLDAQDEPTLQAIVKNGATPAARDASGTEIDLLLSISGFSYGDIAKDAVTFRGSGTDVRVGSLEKLLRSQEASGRPKDRIFLQLLAARSEDDEA